MRRLGDLEYEPYRDRSVSAREVSLVYRNLMRGDGVWWSISQRGLVVAHCRSVVIRGATFVVRAAGRDKVRRTGVKNVHAFVRGVVDPWAAGLVLSHGAPARVAYNPKSMDGFTTIEPYVGRGLADGGPSAGQLLAGAAVASLSWYGVEAYGIVTACRAECGDAATDAVRHAVDVA